MPLARILSPVRGGLWVFFLAHLSHHLCTGILAPLLPLIRDDFDLNYFQSGLLVSVSTLVYGLCQIPVGRLADRYSKRLVIVVGLTGLSAATLLTGAMQSYFLVLALLAIMGMFGSTYHPSASSFIAELWPKEQRGRVLGIHLTGGSSSFIVVPLLAGFISQGLGWRGAYLFLALPALAVAFLFWRSMAQASGARHDQAATAGKPKVSLVEVLRAVGIIVAIAMISQVIFSGVFAFLSLYLVDKHGLAPAYAAMLVGLVHGVGILGAPFGGALSDRIGRKPVIMMSVAIPGPFLYLMTVLPFGPALLATLLAMGVALTFRTPVMESLLADTIPAERLAGFLGIYFFLNLEVNGLSTSLVGFLMDALGLNIAFTILAVMALAASGLVLLVRGKA
ncbi:MAG: MFS transporter [Chloroflexi bacterium]|nr:MFS transporter [Chloroflexota bacterium]